MIRDRESVATATTSLFLCSAPLSAIAAGALLLAEGAAVLTTAWSPLTISFTHLGTLGWVTMICMGGLQAQAAATGAGARVSALVAAGMLLGIILLCYGTAFGDPDPVFLAIALIAPALLAFFVQQWRAHRLGPGRPGLALALGSLFLAAFLGLWIAHGHSGMRFPGPRGLWLQVHLCVGLLGWVGALLGAMAPVTLRVGAEAGEGESLGSPGLRWAVAPALAAGALLLAADYALSPRWPGGDPQLLAAAVMAPGAVAVWVVQPMRLLSAAADRGRSPRAWLVRAGLGLGPLVGLAALGALLIDDARFALLFGWIAVFGWAGLFAHGVIHRLLCSGEDAPLAERWAGFGLGLHGGLVVLGAGVILVGGQAAARVLGLGLVVLGLHVLALMLRARRPDFVG